MKRSTKNIVTFTLLVLTVAVLGIHYAGTAIGLTITGAIALLALPGLLDVLPEIRLRESSDPWEYGTCNNRLSRRHKKTGAVQFILWEAGEQGHDTDFWINFDSSWWTNFIPEGKKP